MTRSPQWRTAWSVDVEGDQLKEFKSFQILPFSGEGRRSRGVNRRASWQERVHLVIGGWNSCLVTRIGDRIGLGIPLRTVPEKQQQGCTDKLSNKGGDFAMLLRQYHT